VSWLFALLREWHLSSLSALTMLSERVRKRTWFGACHPAPRRPRTRRPTHASAHTSRGLSGTPCPAASCATPTRPKRLHSSVEVCTHPPARATRRCHAPSGERRQLAVRRSQRRRRRPLRGRTDRGAGVRGAPETAAVALACARPHTAARLRRQWSETSPSLRAG
jgi:hypothetical protein